MSAVLALDTSAAIPLLVQTHSAHADVVRWWSHQEISLSGHALAETYSVLTRLPGDLRLAPPDAARLLDERFAPSLLIHHETSRHLLKVLSQLDIAGGAVHDALVALATLDNGADLATRDARARDTYAKVGVRVILAA